MTAIGMTIYFEQEAILAPDGYILQPDRSRPRFPNNRLETLDWSGTDIRKESQGAGRAADSIQYKVAKDLGAENDWDVIIDDDGPREAALASRYMFRSGR